MPTAAPGPLSALTALNPLDGRYRSKVAALAESFSEYGLIRNRIRAELAWLQALADEPRIAEVPPFSAPTRALLDAAAAEFRVADAEASRRSSARPITTSRQSSTG